MPINRSVFISRIKRIAETAKALGDATVLGGDDLEDTADELGESEDQDDIGSVNGDTEPSRLTTPLV